VCVCVCVCVCVDFYRVTSKSWASPWIEKTTQNIYKRKQQNLSIIQLQILPFLTYFLRLAYMLWWNTCPLFSQGNHCTCIHQAIPKLVTYCEHQATICLTCSEELVTDNTVALKHGTLWIHEYSKTFNIYVSNFKTAGYKSL
jgi:hypothetical protein